MIPRGTWLPPSWSLPEWLVLPTSARSMPAWPMPVWPMPAGPMPVRPMPVWPMPAWPSQYGQCRRGQCRLGHCRYSRCRLGQYRYGRCRFGQCRQGITRWDTPVLREQPSGTVHPVRSDRERHSGRDTPAGTSLLGLAGKFGVIRPGKTVREGRPAVQEHTGTDEFVGIRQEVRCDPPGKDSAEGTHRQGRAPFNDIRCDPFGRTSPEGTRRV